MLVNKLFETAIIGGGVAGTSLLFTLARYTDIKDIIIFEKYEEVSLLNSNPKANSQTLHVGDIETNYTYEKAERVKKASSMVSNFIHNFGGVEEVGFVRDKMVLAVGREEIERLKERYERFKELYPYLELWDEERLREIEPKLVEGRREEVLAMGARGQITTVNFKKLSEHFVQEAIDTDKNIQMRYNEEVTRIRRLEDGTYEITTDTTRFNAKSVVVNAGSYSLLFAQSMGYGLHYATLPIGGSFFFTKERLLNSKVYTMQNPKLPFAAVHGDPDCTEGWCTRFGPTAFALPKLERYHSLHIKDFLSALNIDRDVTSVYMDLLKDKTIRRYILRNVVEELPWLGKDVFVKDAQKIIPTLDADEIRFAEGYGGMRPQIIDKERHELMLGEVKIVDQGAIFNMTPSPGASSSLAIAHQDALVLCEYLGATFDEKRHLSEIQERDSK
ncbi:MAG: FAD-dependent oxidoreductase [Sulfurimonas sp.]